MKFACNSHRETNLILANKNIGKHRKNYYQKLLIKFFFESTTFIREKFDRLSRESSKAIQCLLS